MATNTKQVSTDAWINALEIDGKMIENTTVLFGYIGPGSSNQTFKIYLDIYLHYALDIRNEDVLYSIQLSSAQNPLGGSYVWIKNAQEYIYGTSYSSQQKNQEAKNYFQGDIYDKYVSQKKETKNKKASPAKKAAPAKGATNKAAASKKVSSPVKKENPIPKKTESKPKPSSATKPASTNKTKKK